MPCGFWDLLLTKLFVSNESLLQLLMCVWY